MLSVANHCLSLGFNPGPDSTKASLIGRLTWAIQGWNLSAAICQVASVIIIIIIIITTIITIGILIINVAISLGVDSFQCGFLIALRISSY